jgi:GNAT superfamily N-acetyltransferase
MTTEARIADASTWNDVAAVLGPNGGSGGCWCTFWRLTNQVIHNQTPADNQALLENVVTSGEPTGLVLYLAGTPAGWCQVAQRPHFPRLFHTRGLVLEDAKDISIWSIVCVYLTKAARGHRYSDVLVRAAADYATNLGASAIEGYPVTGTATGRRSQLSSGTVGMFSRNGFRMVGPPTGRRVVMRRSVQ